MSAKNCSLKYVIGWLVVGSRGGANRLKIIRALKETAQTTKQLASMLKMSHWTVRYQLKILKKNKLITVVGKGRSVTYVLSQAMEENYSLVEMLLRQMSKGQISCQQPH
jgi:DNA-binding transcriptional ArsR family regulator